MKQAQLIHQMMDKAHALYKFSRELNRWQAADGGDIAHLETLLNECINAFSDLEDTVTEGNEE